MVFPAVCLPSRWRSRRASQSYKFHLHMNSLRSTLVVLLLALLTATQSATCGQVFETIFSHNEGWNPWANLVQGSDGNFYGTTEKGGSNSSGTVFKMTPSGEITTLISFHDKIGAGPQAGLVEGDNGSFYGTTRSGGRSSRGTVFKITPEGELTTLVFFEQENGAHPRGPLVKGSDGNFYGTTDGGGANWAGTVFKMTPSGEHTILLSFDQREGLRPSGRLAEGSDGSFYGTTEAALLSPDGTVFKITPSGEYTKLVSFDKSNGSFPSGGLIKGSDGNFYGTTQLGGATNQGTVFKMTPAGVLTTLVSFDSTKGYRPSAELMEDDDGSFYGTTFEGGVHNLGTIFKMTPAGELTTLVSLDGTNGSNPSTGLVMGSDGILFGMTQNGGVGNHGTIFKVTPSGELITLVSLDSRYGSYPRAGLVEGSDGNFYGTTYGDDAKNYGTVFKVTPDGEVTTLVSFNGNNGRSPSGRLVEGSDGNFYGTTESGGFNDRGTIFKVTPAGVLTRLYSFSPPSGIYPRAGLVKGSDGNFYGTTHGGGANSEGTVFKVTPAGVLTTLVSFNRINGRNPTGGLVEGDDGNFYGTTYGGGANNYGTVFKITPAGVLTTLVAFNAANGSAPAAELVEGSDGNFYGTTSQGGGAYGTVFKMTPAGVLTRLFSFNAAIGGYPRAGLAEGSDGSFYGTTSTGATGGFGSLFKITPTGVFTMLHAFDSSHGANGNLTTPHRGTPVFGSDGNLYGMATQLAVWRLFFASAPALTANSPHAVISTGATLRGIVRPNAAETTVTFEYGLTPEYGTTIAATPGTITGTSATAVSAVLSGLTPRTTYYYRLTATSSEGTTSTAGTSFTTANNLPIAANDSYSPDPTSFGALSINVLANDSDADGDPLTITAVTQGSFGSVTTTGSKLIYTPGPGFFGRDTFMYTVADGFDTTTAQVELRSTASFMRILFAQSSELLGAGQGDSEIAAGSLFRSFGVPAINSAGSLALTASYAVEGSTDELSVLVLDPQAQGSRLAARRGQPAPGTAGALFASFKDPLLNSAGDVAFLATLSGGDAKKSSNQGLWINPASVASSSGTQLLARTGAQAAGAPAGAKWKSFTSVAFSSGIADPEVAVAEGSWKLAFTGFMATGPGGVKVNNDMGLWLVSPGRTVLALRERQKLEVAGVEKQIRTFAALKSLPTAPAQGGGVTNEGGVAVQVFFTDGSQAMLRVSDDAADENIAIDVLALPGDTVAEASETAAKFGIPAQSGSGMATAWVGSLSGKGKPAAIFERNLSDSELLHLLARKGGPVPGIDGATFSAFTNVAVNDSGSALFLGKVRGGGISKANDEGLWWRKPGSETAPLQLLAREGSQPPGLSDGATWHSFSSVALPEGTHGPVFTARLKSASYGHMGQGLWTADSTGALHLIVREGQNVPTEDGGANASIKSFTVLSAAPGSPTQRRSYNDSGRIVLHVVFDGATKADGIIILQLP